MSNKLIMESWRKFMNEEVEETTLTESEKNDLLREIDFLKNLGARMRGGTKRGDQKKPGLTHGWEAAVAEFAAADENAARIAKSVGWGDIKNEKDFLAKIKDVAGKAKKSGDPEVVAAAEELVSNVAQPATGDGEAAPAAGEEGGSAGEETPAAAGPSLGINRALIQAVIKDPDAKIGAPYKFRGIITKYLRTVGLPGSINLNNDIIRGIVNVVRQSILAFGNKEDKGTASAPAPSAEMSMVAEGLIDKIFLPIILEEAKREKTRRILLEIAQKVAK